LPGGENAVEGRHIAAQKYPWPSTRLPSSRTQQRHGQEPGRKRFFIHDVHLRKNTDLVSVADSVWA